MVMAVRLGASDAARIATAVNARLAVGAKSWGWWLGFDMGRTSRVRSRARSRGSEPRPGPPLVGGRVDCSPSRGRAATLHSGHGRVPAGLPPAPVQDRPGVFTRDRASL